VAVGIESVKNYQVLSYCILEDMIGEIMLLNSISDAIILYNKDMADGITANQA
jgi:hypothetical protein